MPDGHSDRVHLPRRQTRRAPAAPEVAVPGTVAVDSAGVVATTLVGVVLVGAGIAAPVPAGMEAMEVLLGETAFLLGTTGTRA